MIVVGGGAVGRPGFRPEGAQQRARLVGPHGAAACRRCIERQRRRAGQHDRPLRALGALDQALGMGDARGPARRRRPAVVDHQHQWAAAGQVGLRIEKRPGNREDQRGGQQQAQKQQPPWHLHRVCSVGSRPIKSRIAGKRTSLGSGGIMRSSQ
jgi:hypothetical protein